MQYDAVDEESLIRHALALEERKGDGAALLAFLAKRVRYRRALYVAWQIAARGLMSPKTLSVMLPVLADDVANADLDDLWSVLGAIPRGIELPRLLDDYPVAVDELLMHACWRDPERASTAALPAPLRAALPLVRYRLGQSKEALDAELMRQFFACQVDVHAPIDVSMLEDDRLQRTQLGQQAEQLLGFAVALWPRADLERAFRDAVGRRRRKHLPWWALQAADALEARPAHIGFKGLPFPLYPGWKPRIYEGSARAPAARASLECLPPARRDAVLLHHLAQEDPAAGLSLWIVHLDLVSDASLDAAIAILVARRDCLTDDDAVRIAFQRAGRRVEGPLRTHLTGCSDERARMIVDVARISDEAALAIVGDLERPPPKPKAPKPVKVIGTIRRPERFLASLAVRLRTEPVLGQIDLPSGRLAVVDVSVAPLAHTVPPGRYPVLGWWEDGPERDEPTAGVMAVAVRFSDRDPVQWVKDPKFSCEITLNLMDEQRARSDGEDLEAELATTLEECFDAGIGLAGEGPADVFAAIVVYIGEIASTEHLYWGLDDDGAPAIAIAGFA